MLDRVRDVSGLRDLEQLSAIHSVPARSPAAGVGQEEALVVDRYGQAAELVPGRIHDRGTVPAPFELAAVKIEFGSVRVTRIVDEHVAARVLSRYQDVVRWRAHVVCRGILEGPHPNENGVPYLAGQRSEVVRSRVVRHFELELSGRDILDRSREDDVTPGEIGARGLFHEGIEIPWVGQEAHVGDGHRQTRECAALLLDGQGKTGCIEEVVVGFPAPRGVVLAEWWH